MILRKICWTITFLLVCLNIALFFKGEAIVQLFYNAKGGCFPWSPGAVEYHDGMTLCPGQRAIMHMHAPTSDQHI